MASSTRSSDGETDLTLSRHELFHRQGTLREHYLLIDSQNEGGWLNSTRTSFFATSQSDLCLAFANTSYWRGSISPTETLQRPEDLLSWATEAGGVGPELVKACRAAWEPNQAGTWLAEAIVLREAIYNLFAAIALNLRLPEADLAALNEALRVGPARSHLSVSETHHCKWQVDSPKPTLAALLAPVLWSAGDLLTGQVSRGCGLVPTKIVARCSWMTARAAIDAGV